jgi:hypothetical protein
MVCVFQSFDKNKSQTLPTQDNHGNTGWKLFGPLTNLLTIYHIIIPLLEEFSNTKYTCMPFFRLLQNKSKKKKKKKKKEKKNK